MPSLGGCVGVAVPVPVVVGVGPSVDVAVEVLVGPAVWVGMAVVGYVVGPYVG